MKYLLIGIGGTYNYGCEALLRGTVRVIREYDMEAEIDYAACNPQQDEARLADLALRIIPRPFYRRWSLPRIFGALMRRAGLPAGINPERKKYLKQYDYVLSIGGDLYTLTPDLKNGADEVMAIGDYCRRHRIRYVLWGASVGPYTQAPRIEAEVFSHLKGIHGVTVRERTSYEYLRKGGLDQSLVLSADPAFLVADEISKPIESFRAEGKLRIALNLSPLSLLFTKLSRREAMLEQARAIERLVERYQAEIVLIAHVHSNDVNDDDFRYLEELRMLVDPACRISLRGPARGEGFIGTKHCLITCDLCIAARMHCAINAVSAGVPTIFLGYSAKARGMSEYIYGTDEFVCGIDRFATLADDFDLNRDWRQVSTMLHARMGEIRRDVRKSSNIFSKVSP